MSEKDTSQGLGAALADISTALVGLHKRFYGKGPVRAKSYLIDSTVLCMLEGPYTLVERTLITNGRGDTVRELRREFQTAMREQFTAAVEDSLNRKVSAYLSQVHTDPDVAVELFMLEDATGIVAEFEQEFPDNRDEFL